MLRRGGEAQRVFMPHPEALFPNLASCVCQAMGHRAEGPLVSQTAGNFLQYRAMQRAADLLCEPVWMPSSTHRLLSRSGVPKTASLGYELTSLQSASVTCDSVRHFSLKAWQRIRWCRDMTAT